MPQRNQNSTFASLLLSALSIFVFSINAISQTGSHNLSIKLTNRSTEEPVQNATIRITGQKDTLSGISNRNGEYAGKGLKGTTYRIHFAAIGYENLDTIVIDLQSTVYLFQIQPVTVDLQGVTVTAGQIRNSVNKMSYTVNDADRKKNKTAFELFGTVPLINTTGDGTVFIKGHKNVQVMIDGIPVLSNNILNSLSPNIISRIEISTNPQSEYAGSGLYAIVNIITVKDWRGTYGRISFTAGTNNNFHSTAFISYKTRKIDLNIDAGEHYYERNFDLNINSQFKPSSLSTLLQKTQQNAGFSPYGSLGLKYTINPKNSISYFLNLSNNILKNDGLDGFYSPSTPSATLAQNNQFSKNNNWVNFKNYLDYTYRPTNKSSLSFAAQYYEQSSNQSTHNLLNNFSYASERQISNQPKISEFSGQLIYRKSINNAFNYNFGAKFISRVNQSTYGLDTLDGASHTYKPVLDISYTSNFYATQYIYSAFGNISFPITKKLAADLGTRFEQTQDNIEFMGISKLKRSYLQWIPSATLNFELNKSSSFSFTINKNLSRPAIYYLNPVANTSDPKNIFTGNPYLVPEKAFLAELSYNTSVKTNNLSISGYFQDNIDQITQGINYTKGDTIISTYFNTAYTRILGVSTDVTYNISKALRLNFHVAVEKAWVSGYLQNNEGYQFLSNANLLWRLPAKISLRLTHQYNSPLIVFQGRDYAVSSHEIIASRRFMKDKLTVYLGASDFLSMNSNRHTTIESNLLAQTTNSNLHLAYYYIRFGYTFGKTKYSTNPDIKLSNADLKN